MAVMITGWVVLLLGVLLVLLDVLLVLLGVRERYASIIVELARAVTAGRLRLEPCADPADVTRELASIGMDEASAALILARAAAWPDSLPVHDPTHSLAQRAERWRPWRAYAAMHLRLEATSGTRDATKVRAG